MDGLVVMAAASPVETDGDMLASDRLRQGNRTCYTAVTGRPAA